MLAGIVPASYMRQGGLQVLAGQIADGGTVLCYMTGEAIQAPGPAEVKSVQVHQFAICTVFYLCNGLNI